ncbi:MAG TPA: hypothetical protein VGH99_00090 [Pseudonocardia sp.]|jgi:hypothetical protein
MISVSAYVPEEGGTGPGRLAQVPLEVVSRGPAELVLPEATVRDERGLELLDPGDDGDILVDPANGGGPVGGAERDRDARLFGLTNVAFHAQRALRGAADLLGHPLPPLLLRIGTHDSPRRWGGGHYRVSARSYDPPEAGAVSASGEVHLGGGSGFIAVPGGEPYFGAPAHNLAIINHEIGHHVCRHTADFRLNRLRPVEQQTNKKIPLDEGSCDVFTAIMLGRADIYGWHRAGIPEWDRRRRLLSPQWTMAGFEGGPSDPHADGTIWASACWSARERVAAAGHEPGRFDRMLFRGLEHSAAAHEAEFPGEETPSKPALKSRRYWARLLEAMLAVDPDLADPVLAGMSLHGIRPGATNTELRDESQAARVRRIAAGS